MRNTIIAGIFLTIATFLIQRMYFTDRPEIIYSLSNEIYTSLNQSENPEIIQQITIKNVGSQKAERIVITINGYIGNYEIRKYSEIDSINVINTKTKFELTYPYLPPDGQIEILIKDLKIGINKDKLIVKHNSGLGKEAFEKSNSFSILALIPILLFLILTFWSGYDLYKYLYESDVKISPIDKILKRPKPIFLSSFYWSKLRKQAIENYFKDDWPSTKLNNLISWQVINNDKPEYLSNDEWRTVLDEAIKRFKEMFANRLVTRSYMTLSDEIFFSTEKPKQFGISDWKEMVDLVNNYYLFYSLTNLRVSISQLGKELNRNKPDLIKTEIDKRRKEILREIYFSNLVSKIIRLKNLYSDKDEHDLSLLDDDQKNEVKEIYNVLNAIKIAKQYRFKLREVVRGKLVDKDNHLIDKENWDELVELNQDIHKILESKKQAEADEIKFSKLRKRVEKQLDIIDRIISDPNYVSKIEDYNQIFSIGNLNNLVKVSEILKKGKKG